MSKTLIYEKKDRVACITLNRPEVLNALDLDIREQLKQMFSDIEKDKDIGAILINGAGKAFCAGGDIKTMGGYQAGAGRIRLKNMHQLVRLIALSDKVTVAAIHGFAAGAGLSLALCCDFRIAAQGAKFIASFLNVGLVPDSGSLYFLPRIVGMGKAKEILLDPNPIEASEALKIGLINKLVEKDNLEEEALSFSKKISSRSSTAIALTKNILSKSFELNLDEALDLEAISQDVCFLTDDHKEGINAFLEKRKPEFNK